MIWGGCNHQCNIINANNALHKHITLAPQSICIETLTWLIRLLSCSSAVIVWLSMTVHPQIQRKICLWEKVSPHWNSDFSHLPFITSFLSCYPLAYCKWNSDSNDMYVYICSIFTRFYIYGASVSLSSLSGKLLSASNSYGQRQLGLYFSFFCSKTPSFRQ